MNVIDMVRGLVRCAELRERDGGGDLWDNESRAALKEARARGWGKGHTGSLESEIEELKAENASLRAALAPIARFARAVEPGDDNETIRGWPLTNVEIRRAALAVGGTIVIRTKESGS